MLKNVWLPVSVALSPLLLIALLWADIPEVVAIHWNAAGVADGFAPKWPGVLLMPALNMFITLLLVCLPAFDPRLKRLSADELASTLKVYAYVTLGAAILLSSISLMIMAVALGWMTDIVHPLIYSVCALVLGVGVYLPKVRPNSLIGIRVPWTLKSPEVWRRTHRIGGFGMAGFAALWIILLTILPLEYFFWFFTPTLLLGVAALLLYPYVLSRRLRA